MCYQAAVFENDEDFLPYNARAGTYPRDPASSAAFLSENGAAQSTRHRDEGHSGSVVECSKLLTPFLDHPVIITVRANPDPNEILASLYAQRSMIETNPD
jgi:hypothetical protein